nr:hypothetical protein [Microctonus hyperodae filamentous virus]
MIDQPTHQNIKVFTFEREFINIDWLGEFDQDNNNGRSEFIVNEKILHSRDGDAVRIPMSRNADFLQIFLSICRKMFSFVQVMELKNVYLLIPQVLNNVQKFPHNSYNECIEYMSDNVMHTENANKISFFDYDGKIEIKMATNSNGGTFPVGRYYSKGYLTYTNKYATQRLGGSVSIFNFNPTQKIRKITFNKNKNRVMTENVSADELLNNNLLFVLFNIIKTNYLHKTATNSTSFYPSIEILLVITAS